jgi:hypothetical protein
MNSYSFELDEYAEEEFYEAVNHYKKIDQSLSKDFIQEFDKTVKWVMDFPEEGSPHLHKTRQAFLNRFPFTIIYKIYQDKDIVVHAVKHLKQRPGYWEKRL